MEIRRPAFPLYGRQGAIQSMTGLIMGNLTSPNGCLYLCRSCSRSRVRGCRREQAEHARRQAHGQRTETAIPDASRDQATGSQGLGERAGSAEAVKSVPQRRRIGKSDTNVWKILKSFINAGQNFGPQ